MTDAAGRIGRFLQERGYALEPPPVPARLYATRPGRGLGPFFPYIDHIFVHDLDDEGALGREAFEALHERERAWVDARFRLPKAMRYRIPVVVTIGVTENGAPADTVAYVESSKQRHQTQGGEKHSTYLFDVSAARVYGQGLEATGTPHGGVTYTSVNPANRIYRLLEELVRELLPGREVEEPAP